MYVFPAHINVRGHCVHLSLRSREASPYLPSDTITTEEGNLKPPAPVKCSFGPYDAQAQVEVHMFDALSMGK
jgi:transcription factor C subunit 6